MSHWKTLALVLLALAMLATGCSTGWHQTTLEDRLAAGYPPPPSPGPKALATPVKLAVHLQFERCRGGEFAPDPRLAWNDQDRKLLLSVLEDAIRIQALSEYLILPPETPSDPAALAAAAREHGADAVLSLRAALEVDWYCNPAVLLDPTIIGMVLIPAAHRDVMAILRGDLFDLRQDPALVWTGTAVATRKINGPTLVINSRRAADPARREVLRRVSESLFRHLHRQRPLG